MSAFASKSAAAVAALTIGLAIAASVTNADAKSGGGSGARSSGSGVSNGASPARTAGTRGVGGLPIVRDHRGDPPRYQKPPPGTLPDPTGPNDPAGRAAGVPRDHRGGERSNCGAYAC